MKKVAVILSGCGVYDGSEIHESVLTMLALDKAGAQYQCFAPDIQQTHVVNHLTSEEAISESRNVLVEAARIARGNIKPLREAKADEFDAAIYPGGFGAALNLSDFAQTAADCEIQPNVLMFAKAMADAKKPQGFICISPTMISKIYGPGIKQTIGNDKATAEAITAMGGKHIECPVTEITVDEQHKVISTPAYMLAKRISDAEQGINKLVNDILAMC